MKEKKTINLSNYRNFGIMAHIDAGKTTTSERILFHSGKTHKIGEVHDGDATMDWMEQEKERGITITSAATYVTWNNCELNLIDTPGHVDFTVEVERSLRVLDGAITVLDAQNGVEPQTETVWRQAMKYNVPRIIYINKMDKVGADFFASIASVKEKLNGKAVPIQLPIGKENDFCGIIDLVMMQAYFYDGKPEENYQIKPIPENLKKLALKERLKMIEEVVNFDDEIFEKYLASGEINDADLKKCIRKGVLTANFFPVLCGSSFKNKGVKALLDAVVNFLPSPIDIPPVKIHSKDNDEVIKIENDPKKELVALAFKITSDPFVGKLTFIRVYSGTLKKGTYVLNTTKKIKERVSRLVKMHSNNREEIEEISAGDICAVVGLKDTVTGNTLTATNKNIHLEAMNFAEPVISLAIEPKTKADQEKMSIALAKLSEEDPTFRTYTDPELNQTIISGMGELHLEIVVDRLKREFKVNVNVGTPQVAYRETFTQTVNAEGKYIRQSGGRGQYGHVCIKFEPNQEKGFEFVDKIVSGRIPKEYIKPVKNGLEDAMKVGPLAGYPVIDVKATLYDGSFHEVDSSEMAFRIAASIALKEGAKKSGLALLEPIMNVEVTVPEQYLGDVMGDLSSRRGLIEGQEQKGNVQIIRAKVPLKEMFGYATNLRSFTQGRGIYTMQFNNYEKAPQSIVNEVINFKTQRN